MTRKCGHRGEYSAQKQEREPEQGRDIAHGAVKEHRAMQGMKSPGAQQAQVL